MIVSKYTHVNIAAAIDYWAPTIDTRKFNSQSWVRDLNDLRRRRGGIRKLHKKIWFCQAGAGEAAVPHTQPQGGSNL